MRASMHATTATFFAGSGPISPASKVCAKEALFSSSSSVALTATGCHARATAGNASASRASHPQLAGPYDLGLPVTQFSGLQGGGIDSAFDAGLNRSRSDPHKLQP